MQGEVIRSPMFYVGDKFRLISQLLEHFPEKIENYYEPFVGGGSVFLNVQANNYRLNDIDNHLVNLHKLLILSAKDRVSFFNSIEKVINKYKLSHSYSKDIIPKHLKQAFPKTYYARFNQEGYKKLRNDAIQTKYDNPLFLYILLIYGFNRMLRFNSKGEFNIPVGNVDFNKNVGNALNTYFDFVNDKQIRLTAFGFQKMLLEVNYSKNDFFYIDPPYLLTKSEYTKNWNEETEKQLYEHMDVLDNNNIKFAFSNVTHYQDKTNNLLIKWMRRYHVHTISSNYISYHHNKKKKITEVLVTNY